MKKIPVNVVTVGIGMGLGVALAASVTSLLLFGRVKERIAEANQEAAVAAAQADAATRNLQRVAARAVAQGDTIAQLRDRADQWERRYRQALRDIPPEPVALPPVCQPCVDRSAALVRALGAADSTIAQKDSALTFAADRYGTVVLELSGVEQELIQARDALRRQSERTVGETRPKLFGLLPLPAVHAGYGAILANGKIQHGPGVSISYRVEF